MLGKHVFWIDLSADEVKLDNVTSNGFPDSMVRQSDMTLVELGMRQCVTCDDELIITKQIRVINAHAQVDRCIGVEPTQQAPCGTPESKQYALCGSNLEAFL
jgi:hypothetical protein